MRKKLFILVIILLQLAAIINGGRITNPIKVRAASSGLVAAYGFEESSGTILNDQSGNANNGTLQNGPVWVNGKFGKALKFDGTNDLVTIPHTNSLDLTTGMTLEAWVYPTTAMSGWDTIMLKESASGLVYSLYANGDGNIPSTYILSNNTEHGTGGVTTLPLNTWSHVAATFDGATIRLYLNGTQVKSTTFSGSIQTSAGGIGIGGNMIWRDESFPGIIDEIRIYNRALSASEISADMNVAVSAPTTSPTPALTIQATPTAAITSTRTTTPVTDPSPTGAPTTIFTATRTPTSAATSTITRTPSSTPTKTPTSAPQIIAPLKVSTANPRYFEDPNGNIVFLTGSHTWCNLMDCGDTNPITSTFNYSAYLDFLVSHNHNFFRLWRNENARGGEAGPNFWFAPMPYQRSGTCCAFDGGNKFDLTQFNQAYFDRLRSRVIAARDRGIYVSIMLFDGWSVESKISNHNPWAGHPYNLSNNVNSINGDTNNDNQGGETHTLSNSYITTNITPLQEAYVRKVIDTVNDLDNVLYEISNESTGSSANTAWQYHMINYIKSYEASKPKQHPVGMTATWPNSSNTDLYNSPADWISLGSNVDINTYVPPAADGSKVILADTDHLCGICGNRQWVWKSFTRGENPIFMDVYDAATSSRGAFLQPTGKEAEIRNNLGYARSYANRMNLAAMTPQPALCSTGYCLARNVANGAEYLAYLPNGGSINLNLTAASGTLSVEWFNPTTGATLTGSSVTGGGTRTLTPPFSGDAVVYLKATTSFTPTPNPSTTPSRTPLPTSTMTASRNGTQTNTPTPTRPPLNTPTSTLNATPTAISVPVASYNFNAGTGTALSDRSGNNNNGTLTNGPVWTTSGKYGSALTFDGTNDKVAVPDSNSLDLSNNMTIEAWVYPTGSVSGQATILVKEQSTANIAYAIFLNNGNLPNGYLYINGIQGLQGTTAIPLNVWSHLAMTYDGISIKLYVNGQIAGNRAQTGTIINTTGVLNIGNSNISSTAGFLGRLDEIRIYNRALAQQEIQIDMNTPIN